MIGFLKGMNINYFAILTASLNKEVFVLNLSKNSILCHIKHKMFGFLKGMNINYFAILNASIIKRFSFLIYLKTASCATYNIK
jgi:hypothetical protein